jgi:hypothetical protein
VTALMEGFTASIRRGWASVTSRLEVCLDLIAWASSVALMRQSSVAVLVVTLIAVPTSLGCCAASQTTAGRTRGGMR